MAIAPKQEFPPLLNVGFHPVGMVELRRLCVDRFPLSVTRPSIMRNLVDLIDLMHKQRIPSDVWIDGSFLTEKLDPGDVDLLWVIDAQIFLGLSTSQLAFVNWYSTNNLNSQYKCDNYVHIVDNNSPSSQWMTAYWLRQFGFSRSDKMKGLAVVHLPLAVVP